MILSENVSVKVCHQNYKYYEDKGYQVTKELDKRNRITVPTQYITVKWTDIPHKSNQKIELKCDICGKKFERKIRYYYLSHENNNIDACSKKCQSVKSMETKIDKYGTVNPAEISIQINGNIGRPEKYNIDSKYYKFRNTKYGDNTGFVLWLNTFNSRKFLEIIDKFYELVPSMKYKFLKYYSL